ncbi:hypothetical protein DCS_01980 [Drechmeria coniospora]|uniref:20S-pre-rRNA D-site endonuclease NOB1 n=1 Tax=Drechmeria coniospora TaxID=98403 RepID=A0A151GUY9_DRECN|nr:hypothetical protein DCS_01980 [Drechmeria coniospora]KYK60842.1 hypothetical protein DCS_01980 [Drechmeria coniospora]
MADASEPGSVPTAVQKPIHSLVLDTGPLIKNDPPVSVLLAKAVSLYTIPSVIPEIRDAATRSRVQTTLLPFVTVRSPKAESVKHIQAFSRRTGDLAVLSRPDLEILALGYELECERNGGDWRLRNTPGQKTLNGRPNQASNGAEGVVAETAAVAPTPEISSTESGTRPESKVVSDPRTEESELESNLENLDLNESSEVEDSTDPSATTTALEAVATTVEMSMPVGTDNRPDGDAATETAQSPQLDVSDDSDDDDGWITPSNLKKHQAMDSSTAVPAQCAQSTLQAAVLTSDYAMQNVALRMNLNLITPSFARITQLKNWVLRCHGCFNVTKDMSKQFCPSCGQPTLNRVSCSTDQHGNFKIHLKRNFQWNNRGNVYSVPKPVHGSANGKLAKHVGGGKNGWGQDLILAEDQKEYGRASDSLRRQKTKDIMDQDYLPDILTGARSAGGGKIRVGAGRNVNSKRKH